MEKLAKWAFIFLEYDFDVKYEGETINKDGNGLSRNPSSSELNIVKESWNGETNLEIVLG
jgi:hypothetical protein